MSVFILLMIRKYPILMEGAMAATSKWACLYFFSFYGLAVLVLINVLVAFILESYIEHYEMNQVQNGAPPWCVLSRYRPPMPFPLINVHVHARITISNVSLFFGTHVCTNESLSLVHGCTMYLFLWYPCLHQQPHL